MPDRRDAATERLISVQLRPDLALPDRDDSCLDADSLGALMDGALSAAERAAAERHAAACGRCRAVLAAMARTEPVADRAFSWRRRSLTSRWLIPAGGLAAAAVALWIAAAPREQAIRPDIAPATESRSAAVEPSLTDQTLDRNNAAAPPGSPGAAAIDAIGPAARKALPPASGSPARVPGPTLRPNPPPAAADEMAARAAPAAVQESVTATAPSLARAAMDIGVTVVSPNPATRWRTGAPGVVEQSADGGATWQARPVPSPEVLTAGSSPSPDVCWLVGLNGAVLVLSGPEGWRRVTFPDASNLVAVEAADRNSATVRTSEGQRFSTVDGGKTWKKASLQEKSAAPF